MSLLTPADPNLTVGPFSLHLQRALGRPNQGAIRQGQRWDLSPSQWIGSFEPLNTFSSGQALRGPVLSIGHDQSFGIEKTLAKPNPSTATDVD